MYCMSHAIINGKTVPAAKARIPVQDRGFRYGDGVFETVAVHHDAPYRLDWHLKRLARGLAAVRISFATDTLEKQCRALIKKNHLREGLLRIQVTRGSGGHGYLPAKETKPLYVIETLPPPDIPKKPVTLWLSSYRRISPDALPVRYKLCQGLNQTLARLEAKENGCFEALMLNARGEICEAASANIFWVKNNTLYTPSLACGAMEGSMRAAIMKLSPCPVRQVRATLKILAKAEAVFLTNAAWKVLPVAGLEPAGLRWDSGRQAALFGRLIKADIENRCAGKT